MKERKLTIEYDMSPEDALSMIETILNDLNIKYEEIEKDSRIVIIYKY